MQPQSRYKISAHYHVILILCAAFIAMAFLLDAPAQIFQGYYKINVSRSVLVTDYIALGGAGAALLNAAISGLIFLFLLIYNRREPTGIIIASLWTTIGFSLFGKNLFNLLPLLLGVWLYGKVKGAAFTELFVPAMLCATIAPLVSEIAFLTETFSWGNLLLAYGGGVFIGFIFPAVMDSVKRMHHGFCLYNCGIAGGFIATFCVGLLRSAGVTIEPELYWDTSYSQILTIFAYALSLAMIVYGVILERPERVLPKLRRLLKEEGLGDNDYLIKYGGACYVNMGAMCLVSTTVMLLLNIPINGPVLGGIFTVVGFSASGKHLRNTLPILLGTIIATGLNFLEQTAPSNCLAMLFSTGLAPITGRYGRWWGIVIGFLHVSIAIFIGQINGGLNLYNNGFAGGFIAITIVPVIDFLQETFRRRRAEGKL